MGIIVILGLLLLHIKYSSSIHCDKELNYHDNYGYGFDVSCEGLTKAHEKLLQDISVYNEIVLSISNSDLNDTSPVLFDNVKRIKYLSITNSTILHKQHENPFKILKNLEHLIIRNTTFHDLDTTDVFSAFTKLIELQIVNNNLSVINSKSLEKLENLEILILSNNSITNITQIPFCTLLSLKYISLARNSIEYLPRDFLDCQRNLSKPNQGLVSLREIDLSYNKIKIIYNFHCAYKLKLLNLNGNNIAELSENVFQSLEALEKLSVRDNNLARVNEKALKHLTSLRTIDLENNAISSLDLRDLLQLEYIYLANNKITTSSLRNFNNLPQLKCLLLNNNNIDGISDLVLNYTNLQTLDLSDNNLNYINNLFFNNLTSLINLTLRNTSLKSLSEHSFSSLKNLEFLDLSQNQLSTVADSSLFSNLSNLQTLNVSYNKISSLNYNVLASLRNLQVLDIAGNKLENFQFQLISTLPSLRVINIKSNLLSCDVLARIINFLRMKNVSFNINEDFQYDKKNIAGIYCEEVKGGRINVFSTIGIILGVVLSSCLMSVVIYKFLLYSRRKYYFSDEIELIED